MQKDTTPSSASNPPALRRGPSASKSAHVQSAAPQPLRRKFSAPSAPSGDNGEYALGVMGVVLAAGSAAFAAHMLSDDSRKPEFNGLEHLAIYSRPARPSTNKTLIAETRPRPANSRNIDYTPVGSISRPANSATITQFKFLDATDRGALIRLPAGRAVYVSPGAYIEGAGRVHAVRIQDGRWIIETDLGDIVQDTALSSAAKQ